MSQEFRIEYVNLRKERAVAELKAFLRRFELDFDEDVAFSVAVRDSDGTLVGTGSSQGEILRNIAIDESVQGEGLAAAILSALMQDMARRGIVHYFIFTRPEKAFLFAGLGFVEIARAEPYAALLESGLGSVASYCKGVAEIAARLPEGRAALVVNANPFTKGHRALIERAASERPGVIVFVVGEDRSLFPYKVRIRLVREGVGDLPNVVVAEGGKYVISAATFPTYFTREEDRAKAQARLDVALFARQIAPALNITDRYVGEEPYCRVTADYNEAMREILPSAGVAVHVVPRFAVEGEIVGASKVRDLIREGDWRRLEKLVPAATFAFLRSEESEEILEKIRRSNSRH